LFNNKAVDDNIERESKQRQSIELAARSLTSLERDELNVHSQWEENEPSN